ncbi:hypothetical protein DLM45_09990 [Hyphomicrobium methylovorum]|uniref:exosortase E/protease, VPEID-CTERM system n=1 Tax=Hyphomicrobium methylovorum TaxID=84 RepID=UPI0015E7AF99|nr:exosortase E/protease, VPEID-CTERM system [Hyphomicrobium methylovorum]MBA2126547.1 hypothetical protein [Hyphomicrobium methylovorum]
MSRILSGHSRIPFRIAGSAIIAGCQLLAAERLIPTIRYDSVAIWLANGTAKAMVAAAIVFVIVSWTRRAELLHALNATSSRSNVAVAGAFNLTAFAFLLVCRSALADPSTAFEWSYAYAFALAALGVSLIFVAAPLSFWRQLAARWRAELALALPIGTIVAHATALSEAGWDRLSAATLYLAYGILAVIEDRAHMELDTRILGARDFSVQVFAPCSGYEGMALIAAFLTTYIWVFRHSLRFPNILLLLPIGMVTIWLLNGLRIALLVVIGAHYSPEIALDGFHSQFGWISFLLVAISMMIVTQRMPFFSLTAASAGQSATTAPSSAKPGTSLANDPVIMYLAPFMALMAAQILTKSFAPNEQALYPVKVLAVLLPVYVYREAYARLLTGVPWFSIGVGVAVAVAWIATDPGSTTEGGLAAWLDGLATPALMAWLALRAIGTIVMVPIAEELAFRGYLYRVLISSRFETVDFKTFGWMALIVSSMLFGLMHDRWIAAALAGCVYALLMNRSGRLTDAVASHMTTNAVIFFWAVAAGQWSLL